MEKQLKEIARIAKQNNQPLLMSSSLNNIYPEIKNSDGTISTANFVNDYIAKHTYFDRYAKFQHGEKIYDNEDITSVSIYPEWIEEANSIVAIHMDSWARIYHSLSLQWNPLFNVDGTEKEIHSEVVRESEYGEDTVTTTIASRTSGSTSYEIPYDSNNEKQTSRVSSTAGGGTDTNVRDAKVDTETTNEHTIEHIRQGNIGVTKTTELLESTWQFYQHNFFKMVIDTIVMESGCFYE